MKRTWIAAGVVLAMLAAGQAAGAAGKPGPMPGGGKPGGSWDGRAFGHVERPMSVTPAKPWPPPQPPMPPPPPGPATLHRPPPMPIPPRPPAKPAWHRPQAVPVPAVDVTAWAYQEDRARPWDYGPIVIYSSPGRRLYQPRIHGHPAFIQEWSDYYGEWITVAQHPSVW